MSTCIKIKTNKNFWTKIALVPFSAFMQLGDCKKPVILTLLMQTFLFQSKWKRTGGEPANPDSLGKRLIKGLWDYMRWIHYRWSAGGRSVQYWSQVRHHHTGRSTGQVARLVSSERHGNGQRSLLRRHDESQQSRRRRHRDQGCQQQRAQVPRLFHVQAGCYGERKCRHVGHSGMHILSDLHLPQEQSFPARMPLLKVTLVHSDTRRSCKTLEFSSAVLHALHTNRQTPV